MKNFAIVWASALVIVIGSFIPAQAHETYFQKHPYQKTAAIGAGVGAAAGAVLSHDGHRGKSAVKGAVVGGAVGAGAEFVKKHI